MRICDHCAGKIPASKPRVTRYCSTRCRKAAWKDRQDPPTNPPVAPIAQLPDSSKVAGQSVSDPLIRRVRAELEAAGRLDTVLGQQAVALAEAMRDARGAAVAALSKELRSTMTEATKGANAAMDPIDELRLRRDRKSG